MVQLIVFLQQLLCRRNLSNVNYVVSNETDFSITPDTDIEGNETIDLTLSNPQGRLVLGEVAGDSLISNHVYTIIDITDNDGDGVPDVIENTGPNNGDANGDGILDSTQQSVSGALNPVTGTNTTLQVVGDCTFITENAFVAEGLLAAQDSSFDYPVGLVDFQVQCTNPGDSADVTL